MNSGWSQHPDLHRILQESPLTLRVDAPAFFREIEPAAGEELWEGPEPVEERATPATHRAVAIACRRMRAELGLDIDAGDVEVEDKPTASAAAEVSADPGASLGAEWLEDLDGRRRTEPAAVIAELAAHLHQVEAAHLPRALGIWGSALWVQIDLGAAAYVNQRALGLAQAASDDAAVADLLQRRAHVIADAGDHRRALALTDLAAGIFDRIGDPPGRGMAAGNQAQRSPSSCGSRSPARARGSLRVLCGGSARWSSANGTARRPRPAGPGGPWPARASRRDQATAPSVERT